MELQPEQYNTVTYLNPSAKDFEIMYNGASYGFIPTAGTKKMPKFLADHCLKHLVDQVINLENGNTSNLVRRAEIEAQIKVGEEAIVNQRPKTEQERLQEQLDKLNEQGAVVPTALELEELARQKGIEEADRMRAALNANLPASSDVAPQAPSKPTETIPADAPALTPNLNNQTPTDVEPGVTPEVPAAPDNNGIDANQNTTPPQSAPQVVMPTDAGEIASTPPESTPPAVEAVTSTSQPTREQLYDYAKAQNVLDLSDPNTMSALENASLPELASLVHYAS